MASALHVAVLVRGHLGQTQHGVLAGQTVVVGLLAAVLTIRDPAVLAGGELLEAGGLDRVQLLVLPAVRHHLVGVGADEVALEAVEVGGLVLGGTCKRHTFLYQKLLTIKVLYYYDS
ncbi:hypothetical protein Zmor_019053 [Zophobas morio]|uniref:Uncharacterized protein n=1 Tax=Zophobas morio TaxID=2755281 RepID=A0AA38IG45_9CUCU|nr:hypothetical protein Zmor_019053 [Zophobas morio]